MNIEMTKRGDGNKTGEAYRLVRQNEEMHKWMKCFKAPIENKKKCRQGWRVEKKGAVREKIY